MKDRLKINISNIRQAKILFSVGIVLFFISVVNQNSINGVTISTIIYMLVSLVIIYSITRTLIDIGLIFIFITFLFNFGQSIILLFWRNNRYEHLFVVNSVSESTYNKAQLFALASIIIISVTYVLSYNKYNKETGGRSSIIEDNMITMLGVRKITLLLFCISFIPMLYIDFSKVFLLINYGYTATHRVNISGAGKYLDLIGKYCKPAITVLMFTYIDNKRRAKQIFVASTIYLLIIMVSGDRSSNIIYLIANVYVYYSLIKKISTRKVLLLMLMGYLMLSFLNALSIFRDIDFSVQGFFSAYSRKKQDGIIYSSLFEFGGSIKSLAYAIDYIPNTHRYNYGLTYIVAPISILPVVPSSINNLLLDSYTFTKSFPQNVQYSLGGNFLGELYYNFGWCGVLFCPIIGKLLANLEYSIKYSNRIKVSAICIVLLPCIILWIRDYFVVLLKVPFWYGILITYFSIGKKDRFPQYR